MKSPVHVQPRHANAAPSLSLSPRPIGQLGKLDEDVAWYFIKIRVDKPITFSLHQLLFDWYSQNSNPSKIIRTPAIGFVSIRSLIICMTDYVIRAASSIIRGLASNCIDGYIATMYDMISAACKYNPRRQVVSSTSV